jgi:methyltransferase-like protein
MSEEVFSYDEIPYENKPYPQSHPDRLAALATLFGMNPTSVNHCRVLELGCASGGNIIPMAYSLPESQFLGIELSERQAADGQAMVTALGLQNIAIKQRSIMDATTGIGTFDYIIAHGVYSWVPDQVQEKILQICGENLSPNGVAYVSFNTYPGWHFRGMIRDMMLYHTKQFTESPMRVAQARALLDFLAQSVPKENAYGIMLKNEAELLRQHSDSYLFHDHLEVANEPIYFYQFAERAGRHGLQYLAEADFSTMRISSFPQEVVETLRQVSNEIVRTEQYMDFLRNRTFRQTLLCRKEITLNRNPTPQSVVPFLIASAAKPVSEHVDIHSSQPEVFRMPNGVTLTTANPLVKTAFLYLSEIWPQSVPFDDLLNTARTRIAPVSIKNGDSFNRDVQALGAQILEGYANNFVTLRTQKAPFIMEISDRPVASALARHQAKGSSLMTNQLHESGAVDILIRHILELLDGCHDRKAILDQLVKLVADGTLVFHKDGKQLREGKSLRSHLAQAVDENLAQIAKAALLIG